MGKCTRPNFDSPRATLLRPQVARRLVLSQAVSLFLAIPLHTRLDYALAVPLACTPLTLTTLCFSISLSHAGFFYLQRLLLDPSQYLSTSVLPDCAGT